MSQLTPSTSTNSNESASRRGLMLVLSSPSGAGKSSISRKLLSEEINIELSVSATTRKRRPGEVEGKDYYFVSNADFHLMINNGEMMEYAKVFGHYYGTPAKPVLAAMSRGRDVLFDVDWQGTQQLADANRDDLVSVFILPPSTRDLEKRLLKRAQDSAEVVAVRMAKASDEISHYREYDYILINSELNKAVADVRAILRAERLRRDRQKWLTMFVKQLRSGQ